MITPGTLSGSPIYWQAEKHKTGPSQAQKTPALFGAYFYPSTADCFINVGLLVKYKNNHYWKKKACPNLRKHLLIDLIKKAVQILVVSLQVIYFFLF